MSELPILKLEEVGHAYGAESVLTGVSVSLQAGEFLAILGASGCGKSTLLRAIAGFVCARYGKVSLGDALVSDNGRELLPAEKRPVGLVFQDYALFPHMTVAKNIAFGIHKASDRLSRVESLLELVDLKGFGDRMPNSLSGGQKQRVALARALAPRPKLLLLDEPFANLDGPIRMEVGHSIKQILRRAGAAGILVTHDRSEALGLRIELRCSAVTVRTTMDRHHCCNSIPLIVYFTTPSIVGLHSSQEMRSSFPGTRRENVLKRSWVRWH